LGEGWGIFSWGEHGVYPARLSVAAGMPLSWYVDTVGTGFGPRFDVNVVTDSYASNELSVARTIWDLMNSFGMTAIWGVVDGYIETVTTPTSLEIFWDGWIAQRSPDAMELNAIGTIYSNRNIIYSEDKQKTTAHPAPQIRSL
jgi:hypothetical protein